MCAGCDKEKIPGLTAKEENQQKQQSTKHVACKENSRPRGQNKKTRKLTMHVTCHRFSPAAARGYELRATSVSVSLWRTQGQRPYDHTTSVHSIMSSSDRVELAFALFQTMYKELHVSDCPRCSPPLPMLRHFLSMPRRSSRWATSKSAMR